MVFVSLTSFIIGGTNLRSKEVILTHFNKVLTRFVISARPFPKDDKHPSGGFPPNLRSRLAAHTHNPPTFR